MNKRALVLFGILVLCRHLLAWSGDGSMSSPYQISTVEDLNLLREQVNSGNDFHSTYFTQTAELDLLGTSTTPIGTKNRPFRGAYNGNSHKITNLTIQLPDEECVALFGYIKDATLNDIIVENITISGGSMTGGVAGSATTSQLTRCETRSGTIYGGNTFCGGIAGYATNSQFSECINKATINGISNSSYNIGGILGGTDLAGTPNTILSSCKNYGAISTIGMTGTGNAMIGGIAGNYTGHITSCYNLGTLSASGGRIGGIVGQHVNGRITSCYNTGNIYADGDNTRWFGGIVAFFNLGELHNCFNIGSILPRNNARIDQVGGITGSYLSTLESTNCYNNGNIAGNIQVGGITGYISKGDSRRLNTCYSSGTIEGNSEVGGICGNTALNSANITTFTHFTFCYYDNQRCRFGAVNNANKALLAEGKRTTELFQLNCFNNSTWATSNMLYPRLTSMQNEPAALLGCCNILLSNERYNSVSSSFTFNTPSNISSHLSDSTLAEFINNKTQLYLPKTKRLLTLIFRLDTLQHTIPIQLNAREEGTLYSIGDTYLHTLSDVLPSDQPINLLENIDTPITIEKSIKLHPRNYTIEQLTVCPTGQLSLLSPLSGLKQLTIERTPDGCGSLSSHYPLSIQGPFSIKLNLHDNSAGLANFFGICIPTTHAVITHDGDTLTEQDYRLFTWEGDRRAQFGIVTDGSERDAWLMQHTPIISHTPYMISTNGIGTLELTTTATPNFTVNELPFTLTPYTGDAAVAHHGINYIGQPLYSYAHIEGLSEQTFAQLLHADGHYETVIANTRSFAPFSTLFIQTGKTEHLTWNSTPDNSSRSPIATHSFSNLLLEDSEKNTSDIAYLRTLSKEKSTYTIGEDLVKMTNSISHPLIALKGYSSNLTVHSTPLHDTPIHIPLLVYVPSAGNYRLSLESPEDGILYELCYRGKSLCELNTSAYTLESASNGSLPDYSIRLSRIPTSLTPTQLAEWHCFESTLHLSESNIGSEVTLYSPLGQKLFQATYRGAIALPYTGIFIVTVKDQNRSFTFKINNR